MGLFSGKKKIYVSSVAYNLAGDEKDHVRYLPTVVLTKIISNTNFDMADTLRTSLLAGPGMRLRNFARWARESGYTSAIALSAGKLMGSSDLDLTKLAEQIPHPVGSQVVIDSAKVGGADYAYWAEQWMIDNHPTEIDDDYTLDYQEDINTIFFTFPDGRNYNFQPVGFDPLSQYLYANYVIVTEPGEQPTVYDPPVIVGSSTDWPATTGWDLDSDDTTTGTKVLNTTVTTVAVYSDGRPDETTETVTPVDAPFSEQEIVFSQTVYDGTGTSGEDELTSQKTLQKNMRHAVVDSASTSTEETETLPGGVTKVTTTTTVVQSLADEFSYAEGTQKIISKRWSNRDTLIYKQNSGDPELDTMFGATKNNGVYLPFMPVRQSNRMISPSYYADLYNRNKKAYKKAFGTAAKYDDLVANLNTTPSLRDIDHGYIVFGVAVNTRDRAAKKYIYKWFQAVMSQSTASGPAYDAWKAKWNLADLRVKAWVGWREAQSNPSNPLFGTPEPPKGVYPAAPTTMVQIASAGLNYNMIIHWNSMVELTGTGLARPDAKTGDIWWTVGDDASFNEIIYSGGVAGVSPASHGAATLTWQDSPTTYRSIRTIGMAHINIVYKGKGVDLSINEGITDPEVTGFIIPMNEGVFRSMTLVDQTQMSQSNGYIVFNCYKTVKQKWFQTSIFKIILVIIIIVVSIFFPPAGGAGAGILGTAAAVGAALGFAGMMAIIVGAIANALAAMILSQLIMMGATQLFGDKVGAIVGTIASIAAVSMGTAYSSGEGLAAGFSNLASAENILRLTVAAGEGIAGYLGADTSQVLSESEKLMAEYEKQKSVIDAVWEENLGTGKVQFDPMQLTDIMKYDGMTAEGRDSFLSRTLLTGSEIADMTNTLLSNFANITLSNELS